MLTPMIGRGWETAWDRKAVVEKARQSTKLCARRGEAGPTPVGGIGSYQEQAGWPSRMILALWDEPAGTAKILSHSCPTEPGKRREIQGIVRNVRDYNPLISGAIGGGNGTFRNPLGRILAKLRLRPCQRFDGKAVGEGNANLMNYLANSACYVFHLFSILTPDRLSKVLNGTAMRYKARTIC